MGDLPRPTATPSPGHGGITYFLVDMEATASPGAAAGPRSPGRPSSTRCSSTAPSSRPIRSSAKLNRGWAVANTTLAHERGTTFPFKEQVVHEIYLEQISRPGRRERGPRRPTVADQLVDAYVKVSILRLHNWRTMTRLAHGIEPGPESSVVKLAWTDMTRQLSDAALAVLGQATPFWGAATDNPARGRWQRQWLWAKASPIAGGTSEIQRTIIGDRILGLPR